MNSVITDSGMKILENAQFLTASSVPVDEITTKPVYITSHNGPGSPLMAFPKRFGRRFTIREEPLYPVQRVSPTLELRVVFGPRWTIERAAMCASNIYADIKKKYPGKQSWGTGMLVLADHIRIQLNPKDSAMRRHLIGMGFKPK